MIFDAVENFRQPERGCRFSADSIILAEFAAAAGAERLADLGAGCGVVGLAALEKGRAPQAHDFYFVEIEAEAIEALKANLALYQARTACRLHALNRDWRDLAPFDFGGPLDYIMVNPPYFPISSGRLSPKYALKNAARHEIHGGLESLCAALRRLLAPKGRAALVLPLRREAELLSALENSGLAPIKTSRPEGRLVLVEAQVI